MPTQDLLARITLGRLVTGGGGGPSGVMVIEGGLHLLDTSQQDIPVADMTEVFSVEETPEVPVQEAPTEFAIAETDEDVHLIS